MRGQAGSVPKISIFLSGILVSRLENFASCTLQHGCQDESGVNLAARMASSLFASCIFHIVSILFSHKSCQSYDRLESYNFVFCHVCFVSWMLCQNSSPGCLAFSQLGSWAKMSHKLWTQGKIGPSKRANLFYHAHVKGSLICHFLLSQGSYHLIKFFFLYVVIFLWTRAIRNTEAKKSYMYIPWSVVSAWSADLSASARAVDTPTPFPCNWQT